MNTLKTIIIFLISYILSSIFAFLGFKELENNLNNAILITLEFSLTLFIVYLIIFIFFIKESKKEAKKVQEEVKKLKEELEKKQKNDYEELFLFEDI
jgi:phosphotransferase system  glucose/maltose/N-acetylglucosamine-specific IIC component